jgi:hypothetical protein
MLSKEEALRSISHEVNSIKHLYTKLPADVIDWRPLVDMRSTRELLQYLSTVGFVFADIYLKTWPTPEEGRLERTARTAQASTLKPDEFPGAMDGQLEYIEKLLHDMPDEEYRTRKVMGMGGAELSISDGMLECIKTLVAYRHQLFLYARMNGARIGTANNWRGKDPEPIVKKEVVTS